MVRETGKVAKIPQVFSLRRSAAILGVLLGAGAMPGLATSASAANVKSMLVMDYESGKIIRSYNIDALHAPASLTKVMTAYMVFDALKAKKLSMYQRVRVSTYASRRRPSKLYLRAGQTITVQQLLYAITVKSANDAAAVAAEAVAGSEAGFARLMTQKARQLGMKHTTFRNASGLPARGQLTTARDMSILARAVLRDHPEYYHFFSTRYFRYGRRTYRNTNRLLHRYRAVDGMKTGYTNAARFNLIASAVKGNRRVITVVLGGRTSTVRFRTSERLIAGAFKGMPKGRSTMIAKANAPAPTRTAARKKVKLSVGVSKANAAARPTRVVYRRQYLAQVGAFKSYRSARTSLRRAVRRLPSRYRRGSRGTIVRQGRWYKARLVSMGSRQANRACRVLKRRGLRCRVYGYTVRRRVAARTTVVSRSKRAASVRKRSNSGSYAIQVGASRSYKGARRSLRAAKRALPDRLENGTKAAILRPSSYKGNLYRARLIGMSKTEARKACSILKREDVRCLALRHSG